MLFKIILKLALFLVVPGLCCTGFPLAVASWTYSLVAVRGLLIVMASPVAERRLEAHGLRSCSARTLELRLNRCGAQARPRQAGSSLL